MGNNGCLVVFSLLNTTETKKYKIPFLKYSNIHYTIYFRPRGSLRKNTTGFKFCFVPIIQTCINNLRKR